MSLGSDKQQFSPLLYFLENNKVAELARVMMNRKISEEYLTRYGTLPCPPLRRSQEARIEDYLSRFEISEIVHLKGSHPHSIKYHINSFLEECFRRKLKRTALFTHEERLVAYPQLTEIYQLPALFSGLEDIELPQVIKETISKDVTRTYISDDLSNTNPSKNEKSTKAMRHTLTLVLQSFAKYNPYIGYCQGMNSLILFFIEQGFSAEQCFFILKKLTEELLPCDYYSTMNSVLALMRLFCEMLAQTHHDAVKVMKVVVKNNGGDGITLTTGFVIQWFVCLFTNTNLNRDVRRFIMDHFILDGIPAMLKSALSFFDAITPAIANIKYFEIYNPKVESIMKEFKDIQLLQRSYSQRYISKPLLDLLIDKLRNTSDKRKVYEPKNQCKWKWTTCLQAVEEQLAQGKSYQFFVFKTADETKVIPNYFEVKDKNYYFRIGKGTSKADHLRIGRMDHICRLPSGTSLTEDVQSRQELTLSSASKTNSPITVGKKMSQLQQPEKREMVRNRAMQQLQSHNEGRRTVLAHSDSVMFMRQMIQNESFSNLMQILQVEEMDNLFRECISENQDDAEDD